MALDPKIKKSKYPIHVGNKGAATAQKMCKVHLTRYLFCANGGVVCGGGENAFRGLKCRVVLCGLFFFTVSAFCFVCLLKIFLPSFFFPPHLFDVTCFPLCKSFLFFILTIFVIFFLFFPPSGRPLIQVVVGCYNV